MTSRSFIPHRSACRGQLLFTAANKEVLRSQAISLLSRLLWYDRAQFKKFLGLMAATREIPFLMGFLHGYLGFCAEPSHPGCPSPLPATSKTDTSYSPPLAGRDGIGDDKIRNLPVNLFALVPKCELLQCKEFVSKSTA